MTYIYTNLNGNRKVITEVNCVRKLLIIIIKPSYIVAQIRHEKIKLLDNVRSYVTPTKLCHHDFKLSSLGH